MNASLTGQILGSYQVKARIGAGGMGEVYCAWDLKLKRDVAIKVLPENFAEDSDRVARFQREAEMLALLSNPYIAAIYDLQKFGQSHFLVMEFVEGETLADRIARGTLPVEETVMLAIQIASALEAAHEKGIVHRDIKAVNIMLTRQQHVKVLDFGIATQAAGASASEIVTMHSLTATGVIAGTPQYLSPEVLQGATADARSDLWAFGVVLYQALTGRLPFPGTSVLEISSAILKDQAPPLPPTVLSPLRVLVSRCLEKRPDRRYSTASEIRTDLEALQSELRPGTSNRRTFIWIGATAAAATVSGVTWWKARPAPVRMVSTGGPASPNPEANRLFELATTQSRVQNNIPEALDTFNRALAIDPHFSEARRSRAFYLVIHILNGYSNDATQLYQADEELRQVAAEAPDLVNLPPSQAALYMVMGRKNLVRLDELDRAVRVSPAQQAGIWRGVFYLLAEQNKEAKTMFLRLLDEDPTRGAPRQLLAEVLRSEGDVKGAILAVERVFEQAPGNVSAVWVLSTTYLDKGDTAAARTLLDKHRPEFAENYLWKHSWALMLAAEGKHEEARRAMDEGTLRFADFVFWATTPTADFYALLGENSKALDWLAKAVRNGDERIDYFRRNPRLASIRNDPRFHNIINSVEALRAKAQKR